MIAVGADGCRSGWIAARVESGVVKRLHVFNDVASLWEAWGDADLLLLDIPIGLPDGGDERECDTEARRLLGHPRGSSVFPVPCRAAIRVDDYETACEINEAATGRRLSRQTWAVVPKIREVDALLRAEPNARGRIRESHPELCFWSLAGRPMAHAKKQRPGYDERVQALETVMPSAGDILALATERFPRRNVMPDDLVDAMALAVTAALAGRGVRTVPEVPPVDAEGLPMEMVLADRGA